MQKGVIKSFSYNDWLLYFVISVQWRSLVSYKLSERIRDMSKVENRTKQNFLMSIDQAETHWSEFLLSHRLDTGPERHYIIFLQNLVTGKGTLPRRINDHINTYLLRFIDTTIAFSKRTLFLYTKMGPMVIISGLIPYEVKNMGDLKVRMNGEIKLVQNLTNLDINEFVFITRPNEAYGHYNISYKQQEKIDNDIKIKIKNSKHLNSAYASYSDKLLKRRMEEQDLY